MEDESHSSRALNGGRMQDLRLLLPPVGARGGMRFFCYRAQLIKNDYIIAQDRFIPFKAAFEGALRAQKRPPAWKAALGIFDQRFRRYSEGVQSLALRKVLLKE